MLTKEALAREAAARVGRTVQDKWRLDALLGVGATAAVFAATHKNKSRVAIKWMHPALSASPERVATFLREGYVANSVSHPAVVRVFDDGTEDGAPFLVAELLEGETLAERRVRAGGTLPTEEVAAACDTLLDALAVAHAKGVLHRDVKASNLFRETSGAVRVLDFGLASLAPETEAPGDDLSATGDGLVGTPGMMAPEVSSGRRDLVDARSDLWSVGATALFLLTGRFVHEAKTSQELIARVATQPVRPAREVAPELDAPVAAWLDRALAFSRNERFASAEAMRAALRDAVTKTVTPRAGAVESSPAPTTPLAEPAHRSRAPIALVAAVLVTLLAVVVLRSRPSSVEGVPVAVSVSTTPVIDAAPAASAPVDAGAAPVTAPSARPSVEPNRPPAARTVQTAHSSAPPATSAVVTPNPLDRRL